MFQRKYLIFLGTLAVLAAAWIAGWFWMADRIRGDIEGLVAERRADGVFLDWNSVDISGFPIRFDTRFESPRGRWVSDERTVTWSGADAAIRPFIHGPRTLQFAAPGTHRFALEEQGGITVIETDADAFEGRLEFSDRGGFNVVRGKTEPFAMRVNDGPEVRIARLAFDWARTFVHADADAIHPENQQQSFTLSLADIDLSSLPVEPAVSLTLGSSIETLSGRLVLRGAIEPGAISPELLARWRDAGGTLEAEQLQILWGPLRFLGDGTFSLDSALQPEGALTAQISGLETLIDLLEARGQVRPQQAAIARIAIAVLTRVPSEGGPPAARVPVTIQNRVVSVGPVPLLTLEPVVWN